MPGLCITYKKQTTMKKILSMVLSLLGVVCGVSANGYVTTVRAGKFESITRLGTVQLIDVRSKDEYDKGHLPKAHNLDIDHKRFKERAFDKLSLNRPVAVYSDKGERSARAAEILAKNGYNVLNLYGGMKNWKSYNQTNISE